jgi:hypothetical protein
MISTAIASPVTAGSVPYDYSFIVPLSGSVDNIVRGYLTVSVEAPFVAASIGYGVLPEFSAVRFGPTLAEVIGATAAALPGASCSLADVTVAMVLTAARRAVPGAGQTGLQLRLNPAVARAALGANGTTGFSGQTLARLFEIDEGSTTGVPFLYALFDEATGRAFQSEPVLSIAGLGSADGDRPFRTFPSPITFGPRSTLRLEVTERSETSGTLFVTLHGYKQAATSLSSPQPRRTPRRVRR